MAIRIQCRQCQRKMNIDDAFAGGVCRCPFCKALLQVPQVRTSGRGSIRPDAPAKREPIAQPPAAPAEPAPAIPVASPPAPRRWRRLLLAAALAAAAAALLTWLLALRA